MIKKLAGIEYMTGTSPNSLYPIGMWHDNGIKVGLRLDFGKGSTSGGDQVIMVVVYARVQMFDDQGQDAVPTLKQVWDAVGRLSGVEISSEKHLSGTIAQIVIQKSDNVVAQGNSLCKKLTEQLVQVANKLKLHHLPEDQLEAIFQDRWTTQLGDGAVASEAHVEQQLKPGFDFKTLLGSKKPTGE